MGFKKYGPSRNLFNLDRQPSNTWTMDTAYYINGGVANDKTVNPSLVTIEINNNELTVSSPSASSRGAGFIVPVSPSTSYTISCNTPGATVGDTESVIVFGFITQNGNITRYDAARGSNPIVTLTTNNDEYYVYLVFRKMYGTLTYSNIMLVEGSTAPSPYIPYGNIWQPINPKQLKGIPYTGTLPATLTGTKAGYLHRYKIYGNTERTGTPTPENPIIPSECGELETTGVHIGQYKLPIASAGQNVNIYTNEPLRKIGDYADYIDYGTGKIIRQIASLVLTGTEDWITNSTYYQYTFDSGNAPRSRNSLSISTHLNINERLYVTTYRFGGTIQRPSAVLIVNYDNGSGGVEAFKQFLSDQYTSGTPVTIWLVLATPVEEDPPVPFPQIPTTAGSTTISWAGEGLSPSQFDSVQEWVDIPTYTRVNGEWVADN